MAFAAAEDHKLYHHFLDNTFDCPGDEFKPFLVDKPADDTDEGNVFFASQVEGCLELTFAFSLSFHRIDGVPGGNQRIGLRVPHGIIDSVGDPFKAGSPRCKIGCLGRTRRKGS